MTGYQAKYVIALIATLAMLLPIAVGVMRYKQSALPYRVLMFFLLYALFTDVEAMLFGRQYRDMYYGFQTIYMLCETVFFFWFISITMREYSFFRSIFRPLLAAAFAGWLIIVLFYNKPHPFLAPFNATSYILLALLSAYALMKLAEQNILLTRNPLFWFMFAIFFFSFCTFFFRAFEDLSVKGKIWYMHNLANLVTYLIFFKGFLSIQKAKTIGL
jgi:hypothetical protein